MSIFDFTTDSDSEKYCLEVAECLVNFFDLTWDEAVGRVNRHWRNMSFLGQDDLIYHELPETWARNIYYDASWPWWKDEQKAKPKPYP